MGSAFAPEAGLSESFLPGVEVDAEDGYLIVSDDEQLAGDAA